MHLVFLSVIKGLAGNTVSPPPPPYRRVRPTGPLSEGLYYCYSLKCLILIMPPAWNLLPGSCLRKCEVLIANFSFAYRKLT